MAVFEGNVSFCHSFFPWDKFHKSPKYKKIPSDFPEPGDHWSPPADHVTFLPNPGKHVGQVVHNASTPVNGRFLPIPHPGVAVWDTRFRDGQARLPLVEIQA